MKYTTTTKMVTIKRKINPDDKLEHFIRHNSNKRRHIWNKFVEMYNLDDKDFNSNKVRADLIKDDLDILKTGIDDNIRDMYCSGVILEVYHDINRTIKLMRTMYTRYGKFSKMRFKKFDPFRRAFRVHTGNSVNQSSGNPMGKVVFKTHSKFLFKASNNFVRNEFKINLIEPIADEYDENLYEFVSYYKNSQRKRYSFHHEDIKEIIFMEELGKYYIMLRCDVTYYNYKDDIKCRNDIAGIDLGIHNPATIYSGSTPIFMSMDPDVISKIRHYERTIDKIQRAMDNKLHINKERNKLNPEYPIFSHKYRKLQYRFRKYHKRISDIRKDWRFKQTNLITTKFRHIVVDEFKTPDNRNLDIENRRKANINKINRDHAMSYFIETLRHMSAKYNCTYIESPENTTRTCAICGHINPKLPLSERNLACEECGIVIDRDINAAMNCYDFYAKSLKKKKVTSYTG